MATRRSRFETVGEQVRESMTDAATTPAALRSSGADRLTALNNAKATDPDTEPADPHAPALNTSEQTETDTDTPAQAATPTTTEPTTNEAPQGEAPQKPTPKAPTTPNTNPTSSRKTTHTKTALKPTPGWTPNAVLTNARRDEDEPVDRATYTAPKGLLDQLRDLDMRAKALGLPPVSRRELATETAKRILTNPDAAIAIFKASGWTKGGGQLQPIYSTELAQRLDRTLAQHRVRQPGPLIGVIAAQIASEIDAWLTAKETETSE